MQLYDAVALSQSGDSACLVIDLRNNEREDTGGGISPKGEALETDPFEQSL